MRNILLIMVLVISINTQADAGAKSSINNSALQSSPFDKYLPLAEAGDADAQLKIGGMYYEGRHVQKDKIEAFKWFNKAASQGNAGAASVLGEMYESGEAGPKSYSDAIFWFRKAADLGDESAQFNLGQMYCYKNQPTPQIYPICFALLSLSATKDKSGTSVEALKMHIKEMTPKDIEDGKKLSREMSQPGNLLNALDKYVKENQ